MVVPGGTDPVGIRRSGIFVGHHDADGPVVECRSAYAEANPDVELKDPDDLEEGDEAVHMGITFACRTLALFEVVATEAGDDLSNDTFADAVANIGDFSVPGQPFSSLGADKFDANDSFRLGEFDPDVGQDGSLLPRHRRRRRHLKGTFVGPDGTPLRVIPVGTVLKIDPRW